MTLNFLNTVRWFQVLLCITNNSTSVICLQLNDQTVLITNNSSQHKSFVTVKCKTVLWDPIKCYYSESVDLGVMTMEGYSTFSKTGTPPSDLVSYPGPYPLCRDTVGVICSPSWLGCIWPIGEVLTGTTTVREPGSNGWWGVILRTPTHPASFRTLVSHDAV